MKARSLFHGTYGEGYSLDGTDRVAAIARIAGAAKYLMTIHGISHASHTHTRGVRSSSGGAIRRFVCDCVESVSGYAVDVDVRAPYGPALSV